MHENTFMHDFMDYLTFYTNFMDKKTSSEDGALQL